MCERFTDEPRDLLNGSLSLLLGEGVDLLAIANGPQKMRV